MAARVPHPAGFTVEYEDVDYGERRIRVALCPALRRYRGPVMDRLCSMCPIHRRVATDLFCTHSRQRYEELLYIAKSYSRWMDAFTAIVHAVKSRVPRRKY